MKLINHVGPAPIHSDKLAWQEPGTAPESQEQRAPAEDIQIRQIDIHGASILFSSKISRATRGFWLVVLTVAAFFALLSCFEITREWQNNTKATKLTLIQNKTMELPRVVICPGGSDVFDEDLLFAHLMSTFPAADNATLRSLVAFVVAGSGFEDFSAIVGKMNASTLDELDGMYQTLRGNRTVRSFFEHFFGTYGLQCRMTFVKCKLGDEYKDCCALFSEWTYIKRQGRCHVLTRVEQSAPDEVGKLKLYMNLPPRILDMDTRRELVLFIPRQHRTADLAPIQRYFVKPHQYNKLRLVANRIHQSPTHSDCLRETLYGDTGTCYLNETMDTVLHTRHRCHLPYWSEQDIRFPACQPRVIVDDYESIIERYYSPDKKTLEIQCKVDCERWEYKLIWHWEPSGTNFMGSNYIIRLEISYDELHYTDISEVQTVTFWGFMSQLGGQLGLFLGGSIISLCQVVIMTLIVLKRKLF